MVSFRLEMREYIRQGLLRFFRAYQAGEFADGVGAKAAVFTG